VRDESIVSPPTILVEITAYILSLIWISWARNAALSSLMESRKDCCELMKNDYSLDLLRIIRDQLRSPPERFDFFCSTRFAVIILRTSRRPLFYISLDYWLRRMVHVQYAHVMYRLMD
jgi:hypothetical protein